MALTTTDLQNIAREKLGVSGAVRHVSTSGNDTTGDGLCWDTAYLTPTKARSVAASGDLIWCGFGTFALGTNQLDLSIGHTGTIHLQGFGPGATKITSTKTGLSGVEWGANSRITELTIEGPLTAPPNALPLGSQGSAQKWNVWLENIEVVGGSDGIFTSSNTGGGVVRGRNIRIRSKYDCINFSDNSHAFEFWDVDFETSGALATGDPHRAIATNASGTVHSGRLAAYHDDGARAYGIAVEVGTGSTGTPTVTLMPGVVLDVTSVAGATNYYDVAASSDLDTLYAKVICAGVVGSGPNGTIIIGDPTTFTLASPLGVSVRTDSANASKFGESDFVISATSTTFILGNLLGAVGSTQTDFYRNQTATIVQGTGVGQSRNVTAYNATTKVRTIHLAWNVIPDDTSRIVMRNDAGGANGTVVTNSGASVVNSDSPY